jgi:hypothetical protein
MIECSDSFKKGVDDILAKHIAHLFVRDPLVIYENKIFIDDETHTDHFEVFHFLFCFLFIYSL